MDIDEILSRAERTETTEASSAHSEFLNQFKVADFGANLASNWDECVALQRFFATSICACSNVGCHGLR